MDAYDKGLVALDAAEEKALTMLDRESRVTLSQRDFAAFLRHWAARLSPTLRLKAHWLPQKNQLDAFDDYLHRFAAQHRRKGISTALYSPIQQRAVSYCSTTP